MSRRRDSVSPIKQLTRGCTSSFRCQNLNGTARRASARRRLSGHRRPRKTTAQRLSTSPSPAPPVAPHGGGIIRARNRSPSANTAKSSRSGGSLRLALADQRRHLLLQLHGHSRPTDVRHRDCSYNWAAGAAPAARGVNDSPLSLSGPPAPAVRTGSRPCPLRLTTQSVRCSRYSVAAGYIACFDVATELFLVRVAAHPGSARHVDRAIGAAERDVVRNLDRLTGDGLLAIATADATSALRSHRFASELRSQ